MTVRVSALSIAPVKGTRLRRVDRVQLGPDGARGDRAFYVIDERDRLQNGKVIGELQAIVADHDADAGRLTLTFPDGSVADGELAYGETVETRFFSARIAARELVGPWSEAVSAFVGRPVRVVAPSAPAIDRGAQAAASIISRASLERLAAEAGEHALDARRFRMLIEVDGVGAHEEDSWIGRELAIGVATVRVAGNIGRCLVTSRDPETGEITLPTLDLLGRYRRAVVSTEPLPFGVYAGVLSPGAIAVGDPVVIKDTVAAGA
jgi:hypothetical protein